MKKLLTVAAILSAMSHLSYAEESMTTQTVINQKPICLIKGIPSNQQFVGIRILKVGKGSYGSVTDVYPKIAKQAQRLGADAIINYNGSQRFGFWPWRIVRPVITGTAIKWTSTPPSCALLGGIEIYN